MYKISVVILPLALMVGCSHSPQKTMLFGETDCIGSWQLPAELRQNFRPVEDADLLAQALGQPLAGKLCQGRVYQSLPGTEIVLHRAWNSTNPNSQFGHWWAWQAPEGSVAQYRQDYEICYQWSPLDQLVSCTLAPGTKVVVGNGQSAQCSDYLTYPASATQQIYLQNAAQALTNCRTREGVFASQ